ncbi:MAG: DUF975 family protein [Lachnospiraceae bacterium]|nr:DUF975 family protein [Lachnospiraceae bacterium]
MTNWSRARLKEMARIALHGSYWKCVLAALLMAFCVGGSANAISSSSTMEQIQSGGSSSFFSNPQNGEFFAGGYGDSILPPIVGVVLVVAAVIAIIVRIFLMHPLEVGCCSFFNKDLYRPSDLSDLSVAFSRDYLNVVKIQFFRYLYTFLWGLLFIVPGIVKMYEYRMIPYLLSEHPDMPMEEAFARSRAMMDGEKWNAFLLDFSFLGWELLSACTFGILGLFYVNPYVQLTNAALYGALKQKLEMMEREYQNPAGGPFWQG